MSKSDNLARQLNSSIAKVGEDTVSTAIMHDALCGKINSVLRGIVTVLKSSKDKNLKCSKLIDYDEELRQLLQQIPQKYRTTKEHDKMRMKLLNEKIDTTLSLYKNSPYHDEFDNYKVKNKVVVMDLNNSNEYRLSTDDELNLYIDRMTYKVAVVSGFNKWYKEEVRKSAESYFSVNTQIKTHNKSIQNILKGVYDILPEKVPTTNEELEKIGDTLTYAIRKIIELERAKSEKELGKDYIELLSELKKYSKILNRYGIINPSMIDELKLSFGKTQTCYYVTSLDSFMMKLLPSTVKVPNLVKLLKSKQLVYTKVNLIMGESIELLNVSNEHKSNYMKAIQGLRVDLGERLNL